MKFTIREYQNDDRVSLEKLIQFNVPQYFAQSEISDFINYLENEREEYWVVECEGELVGCGGVNFIHRQEARLSWDIVHPSFQGKGIGKELVNYRLNFLTERGIGVVEVRTAQFTAAFYEKHGFKTKFTRPDYWSKGFDLYHMELNLSDRIG